MEKQEDDHQARTRKAAAALRAEQEQLRKTREMPDLQKIIEQFGGYDKITPEAWELYRIDLLNWKQRYISC